MPGCPRCGQQWPDGYERCPNDGTALQRAQMTMATSAGNTAPALAPQSDEDLPAGSRAGEYRIEKKIGEGGMGSVYGARHPLIGKRAAIKVIKRELSTNQEAVDRFVLEAQSVNQIGHPNIVDVFGFGQLPDGRSFFVMEWLEGEALRDRMQRPLAFPDALEILEHISKALEAAHEAGVVHRDLKPDNVFLQSRKGEKPTVKLLDFGLAKLTGAGEGSRFNQTRTGIVMGTPLYLSPEQAKGTKIDAATDVYSLGAMAYEMLSGTVPFKADSAVEIMAMHISAPAQPLIEKAPWVPHEINHLVLAMLDKDPRKRPTTTQVREQIMATRTTAGTPPAGMPIHPSSQPPLYTPQHPQMTPNLRPGMATPQSGTPTPYAPMPHVPTPHSGPTPMPYGVPTPAPMPPVPTPHSGPYGVPTPPPGAATSPPMAGSTTSPPMPASGGKKTAVLIGALVVAGVGLGVGAWLAFGNKKSGASAKETPSKVEVATKDPATDPPAPTPVAPPPAPTPSPTATETPPAPTPAPTPPAPTPAPTDTPPTPTPTPPTPTPTPTPPTPAPKPKLGHVNVTFAGPPKASVIVDGRPYGRETSGRVGLDLSPGDHTIRVQAKGFKAADQKVHVTAGGSADVKLTLDKKKTVNSVENPFDD